MDSGCYAQEWISFGLKRWPRCEFVIPSTDTQIEIGKTGFPRTLLTYACFASRHSGWFFTIERSRSSEREWVLQLYRVDGFWEAGVVERKEMLESPMASVAVSASFVKAVFEVWVATLSQARYGTGASDTGPLYPIQLIMADVVDTGLITAVSDGCDPGTIVEAFAEVGAMLIALASGKEGYTEESVLRMISESKTGARCREIIASGDVGAPRYQ